MSYTTLAIVLTAVAVLFYGAFASYGAWVDGHRQSLREQGLHPTTEPDGHVHAREEEKEDNGS